MTSSSPIKISGFKSWRRNQYKTEEIKQDFLSEMQCRDDVVRELNELFAQPTPMPFAAMPEEEVMRIVEEEIKESRKNRRPKRR